MTIANLKEFIAKFSESRQNDNDGRAGNDEIEEKLEELGGIPASNPDIDIPDLYGPCIPDEEIDEPTDCVYGPDPDEEKSMLQALRYDDDEDL